MLDLPELWTKERIRFHYESGECGAPIDVRGLGANEPEYLCGYECRDPVGGHMPEAIARAEVARDTAKAE